MTRTRTVLSVAVLVVLIAGAAVPVSAQSSTVPSNSVGSSQVINQSLQSHDLAADSVGRSEIQTDAVNKSEIAEGVVGKSEIGVDAVGRSELTPGVVEQLDAPVRFFGFDVALPAGETIGLGQGCPSGTRAVSGGYRVSETTSDVFIIDNSPGDPHSGQPPVDGGVATQWNIEARNNGDDPGRIAVYVGCQ